jgi:Fe-S-cluster containining protein
MEMAFLNSFNCKMCGNCCRNITRWKENEQRLRDLLGMDLSFPFEAHNGICPHLTNENKCDIYDARPNICRTKYIFSILSQLYNLSFPDFIKLQQLSCEINSKRNFNDSKN